MERNKETCEKCHDKGMVSDPDGTCHTCWDCLSAGRLDVHSDKLPDTKIKL